MASQPLVQPYPEQPSSKHVVIAWFGFMDTPYTHAPIIAAAQSLGHDVLVVNYPRHGFHANLAVRVALEKARMYDYRTATLVGCSMGGRLVLQALAHANRYNLAIDKVVIVNGVAGLNSIQDGMQGPISLSTHFPRGRGLWRFPVALLNFIMTALAWPLIDTAMVWINRLQNGPIPVDTSVKRAELRRNIRAIRFIPWSARMAQLRFIASAQPLETHQYSSLSLTYIRSTPDVFVKPEAADAYVVHFSGNAQIVETSLPHCSFVDFGPSWERLLATLL